MSQEHKLPQKLREQRPDLAPVSIVWHNHCLTNVRTRWIHCAPKAVLRSDVVDTMSHQNLAATITNLDISKNSLESLPVAVLQLPSLKYLNASHNKITFLPWLGNASPNLGDDSPDDVFDEAPSANLMWHCPQLEEIELQDNNLTSLPSCLFTLPSLKSMNACKNDIGTLPYEMWHAPNLRTILLSKNYIVSLPILPNASGVYSANFNGYVLYVILYL